MCVWLTRGSKRVPQATKTAHMVAGNSRERTAAKHTTRVATAHTDASEGGPGRQRRGTTHAVLVIRAPERERRVERALDVPDAAGDGGLDRVDVGVLDHLGGLPRGGVGWDGIRIG